MEYFFAKMEVLLSYSELELKRARNYTSKNYGPDQNVSQGALDYVGNQTTLSQTTPQAGNLGKFWKGGLLNIDETGVPNLSPNDAAVKMIDDRGMFQGGEKGRLFGRARDKFDQYKAKKDELTTKSQDIVEKAEETINKGADTEKAEEGKKRFKLNMQARPDVSMQVPGKSSLYSKYARNLGGDPISSSPFYGSQMNMRSVMDTMPSPNWGSFS